MAVGCLRHCVDIYFTNPNTDSFNVGGVDVNGSASEDDAVLSYLKDDLSSDSDSEDCTLMVSQEMRPGYLNVNPGNTNGVADGLGPGPGLDCLGPAPGLEGLATSVGLETGGPALNSSFNR